MIGIGVGISGELFEIVDQPKNDDSSETLMEGEAVRFKLKAAENNCLMEFGHWGILEA